MIEGFSSLFLGKADCFGLFFFFRPGKVWNSLMFILMALNMFSLLTSESPLMSLKFPEYQCCPGPSWTPRRMGYFWYYLWTRLFFSWSGGVNELISNKQLDSCVTVTVKLYKHTCCSICWTGCHEETDTGLAFTTSVDLSMPLLCLKGLCRWHRKRRGRSRRLWMSPR